MNKRIKNILIAIDQLLLTLVSFGACGPDETLSAAAWRWEQYEGRQIGKILRPAIDFLASPFEQDHCQQSFMAELKRKHLPAEYMEVVDE